MLPYAGVHFPTGRETTVSLCDIAPSWLATIFSPDGSANLVNCEMNADANHLPDASYTWNHVCDNGDNPDENDFNNTGENPLAKVPSPEMPDDYVLGDEHRWTCQRKPIDRYGAVPNI